MSSKDTLLRATGDFEVKSHTSAEFKTFLELHRWFPFKKKKYVFHARKRNKLWNNQKTFELILSVIKFKIQASALKAIIVRWKYLISVELKIILSVRVLSSRLFIYKKS